MGELIDVMDAFSTPLKIAWAVWLTWGVAQVYWYRQERRGASLIPRPARPARPVEPRPGPPAPVAAKAPPAPVSDEPAPEPEPAPPVEAPAPEMAVAPAPEAWETAGTSSGGTSEDWGAPEPRPVEASPADTFDPSTAVIETFSGPAGELDNVVASLNGDDADREGRHQAGPEA